MSRWPQSVLLAHCPIAVTLLMPPAYLSQYISKTPESEEELDALTMENTKHNASDGSQQGLAKKNSPSQWVNSATAA